MKFEQRPDRSDLLILHADSTLNEESALDLVNELEAGLDAGVRHVVVDCTQVREISSFGLGVLIRMHHRLRKRGGDLKLASVNGLMAEAIEMTRLDRVFDAYPDTGAAINTVSSA